MTLIRREYPTPIGPVDLLCRAVDGSTVAVEVKRRGDIDGVEQLARYVDFLDRDRRLAPVRGLLCAQHGETPGTRLADDRGIGWVGGRLRRAPRRRLAGAPALLTRRIRRTSGDYLSLR